VKASIFARFALARPDPLQKPKRKTLWLGLALPWDMVTVSCQGIGCIHFTPRSADFSHRAVGTLCCGRVRILRGSRKAQLPPHHPDCLGGVPRIGISLRERFVSTVLATHPWQALCDSSACVFGAIFRFGDNLPPPRCSSSDRGVRDILSAESNLLFIVGSRKQRFGDILRNSAFSGCLGRFHTRRGSGRPPPRFSC
jgi:hypothetical protein